MHNECGTLKTGMIALLNGMIISLGPFREWRKIQAHSGSRDSIRNEHINNM